MSITPMDIQNKEFERSFRGYDIEDVDEFLDRIAKDLEQLMRENIELKDQIAQLQDKNKNYHKLEETMHNAIVVAQETAEDVKNTAKREADLIRREAESEAKRIVEDSRRRSSKILAEQEDLFKQAQIFKMRFRSFIEAQLAALESEEWLEDSKPEPKLAEPQHSFKPDLDFEAKDDFEPKADFEPKPEFASQPEYERRSDFEEEPDFRPDLDHDLDSDPEF